MLFIEVEDFSWKWLFKTQLFFIFNILWNCWKHFFCDLQRNRCIITMSQACESSIQKFKTSILTNIFQYCNYIIDIRYISVVSAIFITRNSVYECSFASNKIEECHLINGWRFVDARDDNKNSIPKTSLPQMHTPNGLFVWRDNKKT